MRSVLMGSKSSTQRAASDIPYEVKITSSAMRTYRETIARQPPETFALLGGRLEDPFTITDVRYCPPRKTNGKYDRSGAHVNVDDEYMNFVVDEEFKPTGKYMVGIWHSHPGSSRSLSVGDESRNEGDMVFFRNCLHNDDSHDQNWKYFIAPITTFSADGLDIIDVWVVTLDTAVATQAKLSIIPDDHPLMMTRPVIFDGLSLDKELSPGGLPITAIVKRLESYQAQISAVTNAPNVDPVDRDVIVANLRRLRQRELNDIWKGIHPLGRYASMKI